MSGDNMDKSNATPEQTSSQANDSPGVIALPPLILIAFIGIGIILQNLLPLHFIHGHGPIRTILGAIFIAYSVLLMALSVLEMRKAGTNIDVRKPTNAIITDGIYRFTRNPMYLSMALFMIALSVLLSNMWIIILTLVFMIVIQKGVIEREERYLEAKFGSVYTDYKHKTRRWILFF